MRSSPGSYIFLTATLATTSSAFDFGVGTDVTQTAGTVAPDPAADSLAPTSGVGGFGNFGTPTQFTAPLSGEATGGQGWPPQPGAGWTPPGSLQMGWPSHPGGDHEWGALGVDCSGSNEGGWTPPSGDQGWGALGVECSGSSDNAWSPPGGDHGWGTLGVECSGSSEGAWTPPSGGQGWGIPGVDCSGSSEGFSLAGSDAVEGSQEALQSLTGSSTVPAASTATGAQGWSQPSSTDASSTTETSSVSSSIGEQGASQVSQISMTESSLSATTSTQSSVGADADQISKLRSSNIASSSGRETGQQQQQQEQSGSSYTSASGSDAIAYTSTWGAPVVAETGTNHTSAETTFGKITSKSGGCVVGNPTEYISSEYLDWVWEHRIGPNADVSNKANWNVMANKNFLMDKFVHNNGSINYCVRWDTDNTLTKEVASEFQGVLERHYNAWNKWLEGYNCWPFKELKVNMVGWATKDASQFEWSDDSLGSIYEGELDPADGVPQCPIECYRFFDNVNNVWSDTSACKGEPYDVSLWLKEDIPYGFGYDWGQEVSLNDTMQNLHDRNVMFIGHEIGHGFGLPDFYGLEDKPAEDFPNSIMMAYSSTTITPSDGWMLRRVLDHVRARYSF